jgi:hypothetical protein
LAVPNTADEKIDRAGNEPNASESGCGGRAMAWSVPIQQKRSARGGLNVGAVIDEYHDGLEGDSRAVKAIQIGQ